MYSRVLKDLGDLKLHVMLVLMVTLSFATSFSSTTNFKITIKKTFLCISTKLFSRSNQYFFDKYEYEIKMPFHTEDIFFQ